MASTSAPAASSSSASTAAVAPTADTEEAVQVDHLLRLAQLRFLLSGPSRGDDGVKAELMRIVMDNNMVTMYDQLCEQFNWIVDGGLRDRMMKVVEERLTQIASTIEDAEENLGDTEIRDGFMARAEYFYRIGDKESAIEAFRDVEKRTVAVGQKLDLVFYLLRLGLAFDDHKFLAKQIDRAKTLIDEGGDWEKRNRLKAYEGIFRMSRRDFKGAADLLLDTLATFTSYELMDMTTFVLYTAITALFSLERVQLKKKVVDASEVIQEATSVPHLQDFVNCLYDCKYAQFIRALAGLSEIMAKDRYLAAHVQYLCRELRIKAYAQFLVSYRSVTLDTMSRAFGVSADFLDRELSRFIAMGRLPCKIDKVASIVETQHRTAKSAYFQQAIKKGDALLNRVSKLARVTDM